MCSCLVILGQIVVFIVNTVVVLLGLLTTGLGVLIKYGSDYVQSLLPIVERVSAVNTVIIALIVTGVILFLLGMTGCIGATCKVICTLIVNASGFVILAAGTIYFLVLVTQFIGMSTAFVHDSFTTIFNNSVTTNGTFQTIENLLQCCGVNGTDSYIYAGLPIPPTCCNITDEIQAVYLNDTHHNDKFCYKTGCATKMTEYIIKYGRIIKNVLIVIVTFEIATVVFDILIACTKKKK